MLLAFQHWEALVLSQCTHKVHTCTPTYQTQYWTSHIARIGVLLHIRDYDYRYSSCHCCRRLPAVLWTSARLTVVYHSLLPDSALFILCIAASSFIY